MSSWECPRCKDVNDIGLVRCACGYEDVPVEQVVSGNGHENIGANSGWVCPQCRKITSNSFMQCKCGYAIGDAIPQKKGINSQWTLIALALIVGGRLIYYGISETGAGNIGWTVAFFGVGAAVIIGAIIHYAFLFCVFVLVVRLVQKILG